MKTLARHGVDGAVALLHPSFHLASPASFPMIAIDATFPGLDSIKADHHGGGRLMAEHVISLGHRRVGMLSGVQDLASSRERRDGFMEAALGKLTIVWEVDVELVPQLRREAVTAIERKQVSMIACVNDLVAIAALSALKSIGLSVPEDVSVIGFDDMQWSSWPLIDLSTIRQPLAELGAQAVDMLLHRLNHPSTPNEHKVLAVELIRRGSTRELVDGR